MGNDKDLNKFIFTDINNNDIEYELVASFKNDQRKKIYYIMTDNTRSENNELNISFFYINYPNMEDDTFYPVTDKEELDMVYQEFNKIKDQI